MPKNEQEIIKRYNSKTNMMFVIKDLMNPDEPSKNKILFTIVKCDENQKELIKVDFFMDITDIKTLYQLILHDKITSPWQIFKSSNETVRVLTIQKGQKYNNIDTYSIKIDTGPGVKTGEKTYKMVKQEASLIYNMNIYDLVRVLTETIAVIEKNELSHLIINYLNTGK